MVAGQHVLIALHFSCVLSHLVLYLKYNYNTCRIAHCVQKSDYLFVIVQSPTEYAS